MGRPKRIHYPNAIFHVIARGNNRQQIFFSDHDRNVFLAILNSSTEKFFHKIHLYCLMPNHVHLVIQVNDLPLSKIMQDILQGYAQWINKNYQRVGHLFQGRYKAFLIQDEQYLLTLCAYIHLNPVRANLVNHPEHYKWSSHVAYIQNKSMEWLNKDRIYNLILRNSPDQDRSKAYLSYFQNPNSQKDGLFFEINDSQPQDPTIKLKLEQIITLVCTELSITKEALYTCRNLASAEARAIIATYAKNIEKIRVADIAIALQRDKATICNAIQRLTQKRIKDSFFNAKVNEINNTITSNLIRK